MMGLGRVTTVAELRRSLGIDDGVIEDIQALKRVLRPRVPEMIDAFYDWLPELPEFEAFFGDAALIDHVKRRQIEYWNEFLAARVDEAYAEQRRLVGQVHARIGLGPLAYLQAMRFVSDWLVNATLSAEDTADPASKVESLRKLVQFDTAIVLEAYATGLQTISDDVFRAAEAIAAGDIGITVEAKGGNDPLARALNRMVQTLRETAQQAEAIAGGDYTTEVVPRGHHDRLGIALSTMTKALHDAAERHERNLWMARAESELSDTMTGNPSMQELSRNILAGLCNRLDCEVGSLYVKEEDILELAATSAVEHAVPKRWALGEGLVGRAARERRRLLVTSLPVEHLKVHFAFGELVPRHVVEVPLVQGEYVRGVIELGSVKGFQDHQLALLDRVAPAIGLGIVAAQARDRTRELLHETRAQAEELETQQEELRQANEELEEHTQLLQQERDTVETRNREIAQARRALEQRADELTLASQYKSEFLANMSHELRTPLNSMLILAKLLSENAGRNLTDKQVEYACTIHSSGTELLSLIDEILDLARIESGKMALEVVDVPITAIADSLERTFRPVATECSLAFEVTLSPELPQLIQTDAQRLEQVLKNLLSNAFKFTEHGSVTVEVTRVMAGFRAADLAPASAAQLVAFSIRDTGIGIPADKQQAIFEAFQQAESGTQRKYGGTGLGLSISRELARLLGGSLTVESTPGEGSTFTLFVPSSHRPRADVPKGSPMTAGSTSPSIPLPRPSGEGTELPPAVVPDDRTVLRSGDRVLLVIEDDLTFAGILLDLARERGFKVLVAADGSSGLSLAKHFGPNAITLDIQLPDMNGWMVLDRLKHDATTRHIPVHIVSVEGERLRGIEQGAVTSLKKPVDADKLSEILDTIRHFSERTVRHLLVVEDDPVECKSIVELIGNSDVASTSVGTAAEALDALEREEFDCMVLDLGLPDLSGFDLVDEVQKRQRHRALPIIVYTGRELTHEQQNRLKRTTDTVIIKSARSPERLLAETALFLHRVESSLPEEKQHMIRQVREHDPRLVGKRVLVVDDDMRNIFALTSILESRGMAVAYAENGQDALGLLQNAPDPVDVVLMDVMMPGMDGYQTTREIRRRPGFDKLPIIAVTAKAMQGDREKCIAAGANDYIAKPVDTDQLLSVLRVWLYAPSARHGAG